MWGGADERESIRTIHAAIEKGVNLIDTAPVYGFGRSEEIVGKAIAEYGRREKLVIATKVALEWKDGEHFPERVAPKNFTGDRRLAAAAGHRVHRYLPGSLAGSADARSKRQQKR